MIRFLSILALCLAIPLSAAEPAKYALVVGIDAYEAKGKPTGGGRGVWTDLEGAVSDAQCVREVLVHRSGFPAENVMVLHNAAATRQAILDGFDSMLAKAVEGDTVLFYYAGHGSQMRNSKTKEMDGKDETIVPADSWTGTLDIRDKELARIFHRFLDKRIKLTVIMDSCHSGSASRAAFSPKKRKTRFIKPDERDAADDYDPGTSPEERGALVLSAALDYQEAEETDDEQGRPRGLFTWAFLKALNTGAGGEPAAQVFARTRALMHATGSRQEPVIGGLSERQALSLFGETPGETGTAVLITVLSVKGKESVELQGGYALGLNKGCELARVKRNDREPEVSLCIDRVDSLEKSNGVITAGLPANVKPGDLFEVKRWVLPARSLLRVWAPACAWTREQLTGFAAAMRGIGDEVEWVTDPVGTEPTHILLWDGEQWRLSLPNGTSAAMGPQPAKDAVAAKVRETATGKARFFLSLPIDAARGAQLHEAINGRKSAIDFAASPTGAHYHLAGRFTDGRIEYAWLLPGVAAREAGSDFPLPLASDWAADSGEGTGPVDALHRYAVNLARIVGWLTLDNPAANGAFPYRLALKNRATGSVLTGGEIAEGESFLFVLAPISERLKQKALLRKRHIYIFAIDSYGKATLIFPRGGSVDNLVEPPAPGTASTIELKGGFRVSPPFGTDTFFMITTETPIMNPEIVFNFEGARTRGGAGEDGLSGLINGYGTATRGAPSSTAGDWSVERITFKSGKTRTSGN